MGSKLARSVFGTKRSARVAARAERVGAAMVPAAARAPAADFRKVLRFTTFLPLSALRRQRVEQGLRGTQIRRLETLRKAAIDRRENLSRLVVAALGHPHVGKAEDDPQFPEQ